MKAIDVEKEMLGKQFGRYIVLREAPKIGDRKAVWCRCQCGAERAVTLANLRNGITKSCGCLQRDKVSRLKRKHGASRKGLREYRIWKAMRVRCNNPNSPAYHNYGGRGIKICDRWNDFALFLRDMGMAPTKEHSIDRICNDGNYEPENCRWSTVKEQALNRRNNRILTVRGEKMTLKEAADRFGLSYSCLKQRIKSKWCHECAASIPKGEGVCSHVKRVGRGTRTDLLKP